MNGLLFSDEELQVIRETLGHFIKLAKIAKINKKQRMGAKVAVEIMAAINDKIDNYFAKKEENKEKEENEI